MKKFFSIILILAFVPISVLLFIILNLKISLSNPDSLHKIIDQSKVSSIASMYVKDSIVQEKKIDLDQGKTFEDLNMAVSEEKINPFLNEVLDKFILAINDPKDENLTFNTNFEIEINSQNYSFEKTVYLKDNLFFNLISRANSVITYLLIILALLAIPATLLFSNKKGERIGFLGSILIATSLVLIAIFFGLRYLVPSNLSTFVEFSNFVQEQKLINGVKNILANLLANQTTLYVIEAIALIVIGGFLKLWAKGIHREKLERIETKL